MTEIRNTLEERKNYLETRGVTVAKAEGLGVNGKASGRVAIVTVK